MITAEELHVFKWQKNPNVFYFILSDRFARDILTWRICQYIFIPNQMKMHINKKQIDTPKNKQTNKQTNMLDFLHSNSEIVTIS